MNYILFDNDTRYRLLPFTHTRPIADIRCGIMTMRERWEHLLLQKTSTLTEAYLQPVYPLTTGTDNVYINGAVFATSDMLEAINALQPGEQLLAGALMIGARTTDVVDNIQVLSTTTFTAKQYTGEVKSINAVWDIFSLNDAAIRNDFALLTTGRTSAPIPEYVTVIGKEQLFIEEGAEINAGCIINASTGPVYLAKESVMLESVTVRGPLALGSHAVVKMGAKIYGASTIGVGCRVGGEINNVVFFANSNKSHEGYLGNAVIGEWCNMGADTNCSNLKNNYDAVKIWDEHANRSVKTDLTFCGLLMGDHSKCGINTMFNTGTVVGVSANIFGAGFPEKFIPSFCWGGSEGITTYNYDRAMETAERMMARRSMNLSDAEREMYRHIFSLTEKQRALFAN